MPRIVDHHQRRRGCPRPPSASWSATVERGHDPRRGAGVGLVDRGAQPLLREQAGTPPGRAPRSGDPGRPHLQKTLRSNRSSLETIRATLEEMLPLDQRRRAMCEVFAYFYGESARTPHGRGDADLLRDLASGRPRRGDRGPGRRHHWQALTHARQRDVGRDGRRPRPAGHLLSGLQSPRRQRQNVVEWLGD